MRKVRYFIALTGLLLGGSLAQSADPNYQEVDKTPVRAHQIKIYISNDTNRDLLKQGPVHIRAQGIAGGEVFTEEKIMKPGQWNDNLYIVAAHVDGDITLKIDAESETTGMSDFSVITVGEKDAAIPVNLSPSRYPKHLNQNKLVQK